MKKQFFKQFQSMYWLAALFLCSTNAYAISCGSLVGPIVPPAGAVSATIISATPQTVDPNQAMFPVPHCLVKADIVTQNASNPTDQSTIKIVLRLPNTWNGKFFMGGQGGFSGNAEDEGFLGGLISLNGTPLLRGYSTATTDTGHQGTSAFDGSWALETPPSPGIDSQKEINYAYVGVHLAAVTAKQIIGTYYGQLPTYSYFNGCSNGGRQGVMEASRYPADFDGIIAMAPSISGTKLATRFGFDERLYLPIFGQLTQAKLDLISQRVLAVCDAKDHVLDGIINTPKTCNFKPSRDLPKCVGNIDGPACFTKTQIAFIDSMYQDIKVKNAITGKQVVLEGFEPGSETGDPSATQFLLGWSSWITGTPALGGVGLQFIFLDQIEAFFVFDDPSFDLVSYLFSNTDEAVYHQLLSTISLADVPLNLSSYKARGGKLILMHGWLDAAIQPRATIERYGEIKQQTKGNDKEWLRLFMLPGLGHCAFGAGPQVFAGVDLLENWVEDGQAPESFVAYSLSGTINRPICAYPKVAKVINPAGNVNDSSNWRCGDDD